VIFGGLFDIAGVVAVMVACAGSGDPRWSAGRCCVTSTKWPRLPQPERRRGACWPAGFVRYCGVSFLNDRNRFSWRAAGLRCSSRAMVVQAGGAGGPA